MNSSKEKQEIVDRLLDQCNDDFMVWCGKIMKMSVRDFFWTHVFPTGDISFIDYFVTRYSDFII